MPEEPYLEVSHLSIRHIKRIFGKIEVNPFTGCWEWTGRRTADGCYGRVVYNRRSELAHRLMYAWLVERIPRGIGKEIPQLDHAVCDNPPCCNPAHLKLVSGRENSLRSSSFVSTNARKVICKRGHLLPAEKNDKQGKKRYCKRCLADAGRKLRADPEWREKQRAYLKAYHRARMAGPLRAELLKKAAEAQERLRKKKLREALKGLGQLSLFVR